MSLSWIKLFIPLSVHNLFTQSNTLGGFTARGYVSYHGEIPLEELMQEEPAEQPEMRMM